MKTLITEAMTWDSATCAPHQPLSTYAVSEAGRWLKRPLNLLNEELSFLTRNTAIGIVSRQLDHMYLLRQGEFLMGQGQPSASNEELCGIHTEIVRVGGRIQLIDPRFLNTGFGFDDADGISAPNDQIDLDLIRYTGGTYSGD